MPQVGTGGQHMATISVGQILNGASARLQAGQKDVLQYLTIFVPATAVASYLDSSLGLIQSDPAEMFQRENGAIGLLVMIASVVFQYRLFAALFGRQPDSGRYLPFIGLAILSFLGVGFATILLIVPGLIVAVRWLMAPAIFAAEASGVIESMRQSWDRTRGNTKPVIVSILVFLLLVIVASAILGMLGAVLSGVPLVTDLIEAALGEAVTVVMIAMSVALYDLIGGGRERLQAVFA